MSTMYLLAGRPGLELIILVMVIPTMVVLLVMSIALSKSPRQRLINVLSGGVFSVASIIMVVILMETKVIEIDNTALFVSMVAAIGAAIGVILASVARKLFSIQPS